MNRAVGHFLQKQGIYVIPNIRWGDERSYTTVEYPEKFAFLGIEKHSIAKVGYELYRYSGYADDIEA